MTEQYITTRPPQNTSTPPPTLTFITVPEYIAQSTATISLPIPSHSSSRNMASRPPGCTPSKVQSNRHHWLSPFPPFSKTLPSTKFVHTPDLTTRNLA